MWCLIRFVVVGTAVAAAHQTQPQMGRDRCHTSLHFTYEVPPERHVRPERETGLPGHRRAGRSRHLRNTWRSRTAINSSWWALSLIGAKPLGGESGSKKGKKGADKGIDGVLNFIDDPKGKPSRVLIQVKSGVKSGDIRDLRGVVEREEAAIGVFVTLEPPSRDMVTEAASAGFYHSKIWNKDFPRIRFSQSKIYWTAKRSICRLQHGTFKQAGKVRKADGKQGELGI